MINYVFLIIGISLLLLIIGILTSKNIFEKILFTNSFSNHIIILIVLFSIFDGNNSFIDIALIYALLGFIANAALLKRFKDKRF